VSDEIPASFMPAMWQVFEETIRGIGYAGGFNAAGWEQVRTELRTGRWQTSALPARCRGSHDVLLHDVTEALALTEGVPLGWYRRGDLLPEAPDDLSGLEDGAA
jgi:hypothetical protein